MIRRTDARDKGLEEWMGDKVTQYSHQKKRLQKKSERLLNDGNQFEISLESRTNSQASLGANHSNDQESHESSLLKYMQKAMIESKGDSGAQFKKLHESTK